MGEIHPTVPTVVAPSVARVVMPKPDRDDPLGRGRSQGMEGVQQLLEAARENGLVAGHFRGLLHIAIGRTVTRPDGTVIATGLTWRELSVVLRQMRFDRELVREFGADPDTLAPRDRERFWYSAIAHARVDSREAVADAEKLIGRLKDLGFVVGSLPGSGATSRTPAPQPRATPPEPKEERSAKRKKK
jgi:hypothetical protein